MFTYVNIIYGSLCFEYNSNTHTHHGLNRNFLENYCVGTQYNHSNDVFVQNMWDNVVKKGIGITKWYFKGGLEETLLFCSIQVQSTFK
jgi:hypothetical protein